MRRLAAVLVSATLLATGIATHSQVVSADLDSSGEYTPLTPHRILDTRDGTGRGGIVARVGPGETVEVDVTGVGGVPATGVAAVVVNVTAVEPTAAGYLTLHARGMPRPEISNLNLAPGRTVANLATVPVGTSGRIAVFNAYGEVDVLLDIAGFYAATEGPSGGRFHAVAPRRVMDTRDRPYVPRGPVGALGAAYTVALNLKDPAFGVIVPDVATAVALNVTITDATAPSYLTVFPADGTRPTVSNLNFGASDTIANQVIVRLPEDGVLNLYNYAGSVHVVADLVGFYDEIDTADQGRFVPLQPHRAIDTRAESPFPGSGRLGDGDVLFMDPGDDGLAALVMNVTVTDVVGGGYVTAFPYSVQTPEPLASTLNYAAGRTVPNHAIARTGPLIAFANHGGETHLVVDVFGAFM